VSANLIVDLGGTTQVVNTITSPPFLSGGAIFAGSGTVIGNSCNMLHSDTYCNMIVTGASQSGQLRIQVQCSDSDVSGTYTDPTSGLAQLPTTFQSGGILWLNSGGAGNGLFTAQASGFTMGSGLTGFAFFAAFQRPYQFARANVLGEGSAQYAGPLMVDFISQLKTTGSGGGAWSQSGVPVVNV
jgi:hypothetical protein